MNPDARMPVTRIPTFCRCYLYLIVSFQLAMAGCNWASIRNESNPEELFDRLCGFDCRSVGVAVGASERLEYELGPEILYLQIGTFESLTEFSKAIVDNGFLLQKGIDEQFKAKTLSHYSEWKVIREFEIKTGMSMDAIRIDDDFSVYLKDDANNGVTVKIILGDGVYLLYGEELSEP